MKKIKTPKGMLKEGHTANTQRGEGDYYGAGVKQKIGRSRDVTGAATSKSKKLGKPPKALA